MIAVLPQNEADYPLSLLKPHILQHLIGVVDLKNGAAVHAIAGQRDQYLPVKIAGEACDHPVDLARHYSALGLRRLYVADLDAIVNAAPNHQILNELIASRDRWQEALIDIGWQANETIREVAVDLARSNIVRLVIASETAGEPDQLRIAAEHLAAERIVLSLDYMNGKFVAGEGSDRQWIQAANSVGINHFIILDLANVGSAAPYSHSVTQADSKFRMLRELDANARIYTGGGIKKAEQVEGLVSAGMDGCLVATALHRNDGS